ncbi:hypothetical protein [uncultured Psychrobacter sp.]|uniref:hypothetical protein n=1 Tax=uncultured Psychrobacter sp. TaxID=259303 RepID=UPI0034590145
MKPNLFKYSVLTIGIVAAMSVSNVNAAEVTYSAEDAFMVKNKATATYTVANNTTEQRAESNEVTVSVTETGAFSLIATSADDVPNDDANKDRPINPQAGSSVDFTHRLTNDGNVTDTYTIMLANPSNSVPASAAIKYQIKDSSGANVGSLETVNIGGTITLKATQSADIIITATTNVDRFVNANTSFTVSATSAYLTAKGQTGENRRAVNTNNAITTTPVYAITKSATTNLGNKTFDVNNANAYVDYTVTVKNEGNSAGTAVSITDTLPVGLIVIRPSESNYKAPTVSATSGSSAQTAVISTNGKDITVTNQNIKMGETITVTFRAKKDATTPASGTNITNYAVIKDSTKDNGTFDLIDSSGDGAGGVTEKNYEDPANPAVGKDDNTQATITTSNQSRALAISPGTNKEVALQSTGNTYLYTITNNGTDIVEAATTNAVKLSIKPTVSSNNSNPDDPNIKITRVFVDANNDGIFNTGETILTSDSDSSYDLNAARATGIAPGAFVKIGVEVATTGSGSNLAGNTNNLGNFETMTVSVLPQGPVSGTPAPTSVNTTSTTTMQGINLQKFQTVADCTTAITSIPNNDSRWSQTNVTATAGQCVFYKLAAKNTFSAGSGINISALQISDNIDARATYRNDFVATPTSATNDTTGSTVKGTFATLAPQESGTIRFSTKISQTGIN